MKIKSIISSLSILAMTQTSQAALTIVAEETVGGDVVFSYSGTLDITGAVIVGTQTGGAYSGVIPDLGIVGNSTTYDGYTITGGGTFGTGGNAVASSSTGDSFQIRSNDLRVRLPDNYVSGASISGSVTFTSTDFATLGIDTSAPINWALPNDTITLQFTPIPEPSSAALLGLSSLALVLRRKRN